MLSDNGVYTDCGVSYETCQTHDGILNLLGGSMSPTYTECETSVHTLECGSNSVPYADSYPIRNCNSNRTQISAIDFVGNVFTFFNLDNSAGEVCNASLNIY